MKFWAKNSSFTGTLKRTAEKLDVEIKKQRDRIFTSP